MLVWELEVDIKCGYFLVSVLWSLVDYLLMDFELWVLGWGRSLTLCRAMDDRLFYIFFGIEGRMARLDLFIFLYVFCFCGGGISY